MCKITKEEHNRRVHLVKLVAIGFIAAMLPSLLTHTPYPDADREAIFWPFMVLFNLVFSIATAKFVIWITEGMD